MTNVKLSLPSLLLPKSNEGSNRGSVSEVFTWNSCTISVEMFLRGSKKDQRTLHWIMWLKIHEGKTSLVSFQLIGTNVKGQRGGLFLLFIFGVIVALLRAALQLEFAVFLVLLYSGYISSLSKLLPSRFATELLQVSGVSSVKRGLKSCVHTSCPQPEWWSWRPTVRPVEAGQWMEKEQIVIRRLHNSIVIMYRFKFRPSLRTSNILPLYLV